MEYFKPKKINPALLAQMITVIAKVQFDSGLASRVKLVFVGTTDTTISMSWCSQSHYK